MGLKMLSNLEILHDLGYVHGDIKPNNILISTKDSDFYLIDFGKASKFKDSKGNHIQNQKTKFNGNEWFSSPFVIGGHQ